MSRYRGSGGRVAVALTLMAAALGHAPAAGADESNPIDVELRPGVHRLCTGKGKDPLKTCVSTPFLHNVRLTVSLTAAPMPIASLGAAESCPGNQIAVGGFISAGEGRVEIEGIDAAKGNKVAVGLPLDPAGTVVTACVDVV